MTMMTEKSSAPHQKGDLQVVGQRIPRLDALAKVTGQATYTGDVSLPGLLYAAIVPSPAPNGRIRGIDTAAALAIPGVKAVVTGADLVDRTGGIRCRATRFGPIVRDQPILADGRVSYVGEPVAAVVATDPRTARMAARLVYVDIDMEPAVTSLAEALAAGAPLVHPAGHELSPGIYQTSLQPSFGESNSAFSFEVAEGDVDAAFGRATRIQEDHLTFPSTYHYAMEPFCATAMAEADTLTVWTAAQHPSQTQRELGRMFGYPTGHVRVITTFVGGGFGSKAWPHVEPIATACSRLMGAPVRVELDVAESMMVSRRHEAQIAVRSAVDGAGQIIAFEAEIHLDTGAYALMGPLVMQKAVYRALGAYHFPNYRVRAHMVYVNRSPAGSARAIGGAQGGWGLEEHLNRVASAVGQDPLEFRRRHLVPKGTPIRPKRNPIDSNVSEVLDRLQGLLDQGDAAPEVDSVWRHGTGVALGVCDPGASPISTALVRLATDGSATALIGSVELGQGICTVIGQIVAEALAIPFERVHVPTADTGYGPYDASTGASRSTVMSGLAALRAANEIRDRVVGLAAQEWGVNPEQVRLSNGAAIGPEGQSRPIGEFVKAFFGGDGTFIGRGEVTARDFPGSPPFWEVAAGAAQVAVDVETGLVKVLGYASVCDIGRAINPMMMEGQEEGAVVMGLGHTLTEQLVWESGQLINNSLVDYRVPMFHDSPVRFATSFVENGDGPGPFGAKGGGEGAIVPVAGAVAGAVYQATGVRIDDLPLTPERVWRSLVRAGVGARYGRPAPDASSLTEQSE